MLPKPCAPELCIAVTDGEYRHGWGISKDEEKAAQYLSLAAQNSADIENAALSAGIKKGGAAKGELSLAMFELANCFRNGWGVKKDPVAAKHYYETAANMGDTDAMNETAWCYLEGFGCKKDKVSFYGLDSPNLPSPHGDTVSTPRRTHNARCVLLQTLLCIFSIDIGCGRRSTQDLLPRSMHSSPMHPQISSRLQPHLLI
jgi:hypothetical protein